MLPIPLTVVAKSDDGGIKAYFVRLEIPVVEPDIYQFSLLAEGPSGISSRLVRNFVIN